MQNNIMNKDVRFKGFIQTFGSQIIIMCVTLMSGVLLARGLGTEGRGQYIAITMWSNILYWALSFGIYQTVLYYWKSYNSSRKVIFTTFLVYALFFCALAILIAELVIVPLVMTEYSKEVVIAARIYFLGIIYAAFSDVLMSSMAGDEKFGYSNMLRVAVPSLTTCSMLVLFLMGQLNSVSGLYSYFIISTCLFIINLLKIKKSKLLGRNIDWKLMWSAFKYGSKSHGGNVAGLASVNSTQMILSVFLHPSALGIYSTAQSSISPLNTITSTIGITLQPMLTAEEKSKVHTRVIEIIRKSIVLIGICSCGLACLLPFALPLIYGQEFKSATISALILLPSVIFNSVSNTYRNALNGAGMTFINTKVEIIVLICTASFLYVFLSRWQLEGAAIVTTLSSIVRFYIFYNEYRKRIINISFLTMLPRWKDVADLYRIFLNALKNKFTKASVSKENV
ncbi:lipopolysaccharide biosynthesis protein [Paenibacillus sp. Marseille-Q7038]